MDKTTIKEIGALWEKINEVERKLSLFTETKHAENSEKVADIEEALCEIAEMIDTE